MPVGHRQADGGEVKGRYCLGGAGRQTINTTRTVTRGGAHRISGGARGRRIIGNLQVARYSLLLLLLLLLALLLDSIQGLGCGLDAQRFDELIKHAQELGAVTLSLSTTIELIHKAHHTFDVLALPKRTVGEEKEQAVIGGHRRVRRS